MMKLTASKSNRIALGSIPRAMRQYPAAIRSALIDIGLKNEGTARAMILAKNKTGRIYNVVIRGKRVKHQSSAPGQAPANMTGDLQESLGFQVAGSSWLLFGAGTAYSRALELGNPKGNLEPRPFLSATVTKTAGFAYMRLSRRPYVVLLGR